MRVKISYGVDIKDVPQKIAELVQGSVNNLENIKSSLKLVLDTIENPSADYAALLNSIEKTRTSIVGVDSSLVDAQSILAGLDQYYNGEKDVSEGRSTMDTGGNTTEET